MNTAPFFWLITAVGFLVLEGCTFNMTSIWFAIGAAAALISCLFTELFRVQALLFIVVSVLCLLAFRPLAAKLRKTHTATNGDRNLGREATVLTPVTAEEPGRVRLDGVDWNARCVTPGDILNPGDHCRVTEIHSTLLLVERWTGPEAQKAHMATSHMARLGQVKAQYVAETSVVTWALD